MVISISVIKINVTQRTYTRLTGDTGRDDYDICPSEGLFEPIIRWEVADNLGRSRDVTEICCNARSVHDIVK
jgi:hypothetical protein